MAVNGGGNPGQAMTANAAFYHHPEGVALDQPKLMGRHVAGAGFLAGFARHARVDRLYACTASDGHFVDFQRRVRAARTDAPPCVRLPRESLIGMPTPGCLSYPAPDIGPLAWLRRRGDQRAHSLCGVFHTTAGPEPMDAIAQFVTAPLQSWDAVVCPSQAIRRTVDHVTEQWVGYLASLGATVRPMVQLPVIPLGVDADAFADAAANLHLRARWRERIGAGPDDPVVLFVGRLSYHAKANPYPLFVALEEASQETGRPAHLIMSGWFASDTIEAQFRAAAAALCRTVRVTFVDGRTEEGRIGPWAAADMFASLVDNIQETFRLTPLEAMAAGLPVVVTDWDGYRETVRHGVDGFLVPTIAPPAGAGHALSLRLRANIDSYDRYIGSAAQSIAVDIGAARAAFAALLADPDRRRRMGAAGRARVREAFDWRVIVAAYQALWADLAARRRSDAERAPRAPGTTADPLRDDPYAAFAHYPSTTLGPETRLARVPGAPIERVASVAPMIDYAGYLLPGAETLARALATLERTPARAGDLIAAMPCPADAAYRGLAWLIKAGCVRIA
jgi:glycosyltransferase involved in cell wall biosynthesis